MAFSKFSKIEKIVPFYYGWVIVSIAFITMAIAFGIWYSYSVFILAVVKEFNWNLANASSVFSIFILSHSIFAIGGGYLLDRFGSRWVIPTGSLLLTVSLVITSWSQNLWHFQLAYGVFAGAGISMLAYVAHSSFLPKWFEQKRGLALGVAMAGGGLGMLIIVPFIETVISTYGWRFGYKVLAAIVLFLVVPLNIIFGRKSPENVSQYPDGYVPSKNQNPKKYSLVIEIIDENWVSKNWNLNNAFLTMRFWYLVGVFICISFSYQGVLLHSVSAMVEANISRTSASYYFGIIGIMGSAGKIIFGYFSDRLGREKTKLIADFITIIGILSLMHVSLEYVQLALIFSILFGIGYGSVSLGPAIAADIFMGRNFGLIFSIMAIGLGIGGSSGTYICGLLRDIYGTYKISLVLCCLSLTVSCFLVFMAAPSKVRKLKKIFNK